MISKIISKYAIIFLQYLYFYKLNMTTIPVQGNPIRYSDIQKALGGYNSNSFNTIAVANSLNTTNNYTIAGLSLGSSGNISNVGTITATTLNNNSALTLQITTTNDIIFKTNSTEKMKILENGNIGIGTSTPTKQLDVNGSINTNEYFIKGNNISNLFMSLQSIIVTYRGENETTSPRMNINVYNNIYYYVFTNTGSNQTSYSITFNKPNVCNILVVGGGGAGEGGAGGGGGAGQVIFKTISILPGIYNINVGKGGTNNNGYDSVFDTTIAKGGFAGSGGIGGNSGSNVTSGGGSSSSVWDSGVIDGGGGGGGAGGNGNGSYRWGLYLMYNAGGNGGAGVDYSQYFGINVGHNGWFGSGGGGSARSYNGLLGTAPMGGGGNANYNGLANTGGGGGGGGNYTNYYGSGGSGGSGVVIIRVNNSTPKFILEWV